MRIINSLDDIDGKLKKTAVALGTFDGVHVGHAAIIRKAAELSKETGGVSVVFTFSNHPLTVINSAAVPPQIMTFEYKASLIEKLGADILLSIPFTKEFLKLSPDEFIMLLLKKIKPSHVVAGPNYHYGYRGEGTAESLKEAGKKYAFETIIYPFIHIGNIVASSTEARQAVIEGDVSKAAIVLGRPYRVTNTVAAGNSRGRVLGYPTANINFDDNFVTPCNGVYAVYAEAEGKRYKAVANIGTNPTFQGDNRRLEVFLLDFNGDLYDKKISVDFIKRLRGEKKFASADELKAQIALDIAEANKYYDE